MRSEYTNSLGVIAGSSPVFKFNLGHPIVRYSEKCL